MRIGLIADIHGNLVALETVLADLEREAVDRVICLGDVAVLGPQPVEVIVRLRELWCSCVLGNTDAWLLEGAPANLTGSSGVAMRELARWTAEQLSEADWAYLQSMPMGIDFNLDDERKMLCFHGSPRSFDEVISAMTPDALIDEMLPGRQYAVLVGGHTHVQLLRRHGEELIINPGSVGLPGVGPGTPDLPVNWEVHWAEYAVLEVSDGSFSVEFRRVPLDLAEVIDAANASGMPHRDWWISKWDDSSGVMEQ